MAQRTIDILLNMSPDQADLDKTKRGIKGVEKSLKDVEKQANETREKMEKLGQVGTKLALLGGAIVAPFALAMRKYVETAGETEDTSKRLVELGKRWEESQVKIGRVTAEIVLPALEKALDVVDKITAFAEKNPGAVKAALGIGGTLVVLGGMLSTAASIVSTIATVQGLAAGAGISLGGAGAAAGGAGAAAAGGGLAASVSAGMVAAAPYIATALAVAIAAQLTLSLLNAMTGQNQTWGDILTTLQRLVVLVAEGWDGILRFFGLDTNLSQAIATALNIADIPKVKEVTENAQKLSNDLGVQSAGLTNAIQAGWQIMGGNMQGGFQSLATAFDNFGNSIQSLFGGARAGGGYVGNSVYRMGERGREFVLSNSTTRAAESIIGGSLSQDRFLAAMGGGHRITYNDNRRIDSRLSAHDRRVIRDDTMSALAGAL